MSDDLPEIELKTDREILILLYQEVRHMKGYGRRIRELETWKWILAGAYLVLAAGALGLDRVTSFLSGGHTP